MKLKYPGGKSKYASELAELFPYFTDYREPFVGGGAMHPYVYSPTPVWLNDRDPLTANYWLALRDDASFASRFLDLRKKLYDADKLVKYFFESREIIFSLSGKQSIEQLRDGVDATELAIRYLILRRLSVRHIVSTHRDHVCSLDARFLNDVLSIDEATIKEQQAYLRNSRITDLEWFALLDDVSGSTFIFFDPPYVTKDQMYSFDFSMDDHVQMAERLAALTCKWMLTLQFDFFATQLYRQFSIIRNKNEIIVRNY